MTFRNGVNEQRVAAGQYTNERDYWLEKLSGAPLKTIFPRDFPGREKIEKCMEKTAFRLTDPVYSNLMKISNNSDARIHIILVAAWSMLLYRYTGSSDIMVGIPTYKQDVEGQLINTALVVRNTVTGEMTVKELLLQMGQTILAANRNQNYPLETLVYKLDLPGIEPGGDFPLFDISILLEEIHDKSYIDHIRQNIIVSFHKSDSSVGGVVEYNANLYRETTIQHIVSHFRNLLAAAVSDVNTPISRLEILSPRERKQLVEDFNDNAADFPRDKTIYQFVEDHADKHPEAAAVSFEGETLTYDQLNSRTDQLALVLQEKGVEKKTIAAVMMERSLDIVVSILAVWKAGGAYLPIDPSYPQERIDYILENSGARILVKTPTTIIEKGSSSTLTSTSTLSKVGPANLAYIIYTSGSTGQPKGAMVEHAGMMNHIHAKIDLLGITNRSVVAQNASQTFDISVWQFFAALVQGGRTVIYPDSLILDPLKFVSRLIEDEVTILEVVPSYLSVVLDVIKKQNGKKTPALQLDYLLATGEEVKPQVVNRWFEIYPHIKVVNAYGPTEAADDITHYVMDKPLEPGVQRVPIGKSVRNLNIYIVDKHMNLCPVGVKGELCVSGVGVGRGYLNHPELTAEKFFNLAAKNAKGREGYFSPFTFHLSPLYKTGDLACWLPDGTIEFFGRKDDQVKINGFRIELGEIENQLLAYPEVKETAVIDREDEKGGKHLCAYIVGKEPAGKSIDLQALKNHLVHVLPDYMIPAHFVPLETLPLTPNGKIDRKALLEIEPAVRTIPYISAEMLNRLQREAGGSMPAVVSKKREKDDTSPDKKRTDFAAKTLEEYAKLEHYSKQERNGKTYYPLSLAQKIYYYIEKTHPQTTCSNNTFTVRYPGIIEENLLTEAINTIVARYDALRLRVVELKLEKSIVPAQYVAPYQPFGLDSVDFSGQDDPQLPEQWLKEVNDKLFELVESDLFYFAYVKYNREESGYIVKLHHLVVDRITFALLFREIHKIYRQLKGGKEVPSAETSFPSYIENCLLYEKSYLDSAQIKKDRAFWHKVMLPLPPEVDLSTRQGDPFNIEIMSSTQTVPGKLRTSMHQYCKTQGTSLFKLILSALSIYVYRVTGQENFVIGSVSHGRRTGEQKQTPGLFNRFFPINIRIDKTVTFSTYVENNSSRINYILKNHVDYPYELLNHELKEITGTDVGYFGNINLLHHADWEEEYTSNNRRADYDPNPLTIHINMDHKDRFGILELRWEYQVERFAEEDIAGIQQGLLNVLEDALADPAKPLDRIQLLSREEKNRILYEFNDTDAAYPHRMTLHGMFARQVEKTPDSTAAVCMHQAVSYRQLNEKSNRLAHLLIRKGVAAGDIVGVFIERSLEMIAALLAVMKAGGIYLPIGLEFPAGRITYMLQDCGTEILLTDKKTGWNSLEVIHVNDPGQASAAVSNPPELNSPTDPTHILYTSGTTGTPKGVIIEHKNVVRLLFNDRNLFDFNNSDVWTMLHEYFFDFSVWEMYGALLYGGKLIVVPKNISGTPAQFLRLVERKQVTVLNQTPSNFYSFVAEELKHPRSQLRLRYVIFGGESLKPLKLKEWKEKYPHTKLINMYGITETTVHVTFKEIGNEEITSNQNNIGSPIPTLKIQILNSSMELLPVGAAGEIFVSGEGVSRGYLNRPELTAKKFIGFNHEGHERYFSPFTFHLSPLYRTGDLGRWLPNGDIEFLGRKDMQIQLRGLRIEPGEIENILLKYDGVEETAVVVTSDENGEKHLRALLVSSQDLDKDHLRKYLAGELPQYMIPVEFLRLEKLPLTPNGKINRKVLETIDIEGMDLNLTLHTKYTPPHTEKENLIADIWKDVLNTDQVGIRDNFFDIGGNSLGIIQVNERLKELFKQDIPVLALFEYPTIASIIDYLEKNLEDGKEPGQDYEEKDRREITGRGQNKMRHRRDKLKQIRIE